MGPAFIIFGSLLFVTAGLGIFFWAFYKGYFNTLQKDAFIPFTEDEPVGQPTDQIFKKEEN